MNVFLRIQLYVSKWLQIRRLKRDAIKTQQFLEDNLARIKLLPYQAHAHQGTLIVKCDDIGDFLFWQQCIPHIGKHAPKPITFVGNLQIKPLIEAWFDFADHYVWIDKSKWQDETYRNEQYATVRSKAYALAFTPLYTRQYTMDDLLLAAADAQQKVAWSSQYHSYLPHLAGADAIMTRCIHTHQPIELEYIRNLEFIESLFQVQIDKTIQSPFNQFKKHNHLVIFPVASSNARNWPVDKYAQLIKAVQKTFSKIIVLGGPNSKAFSEALKVKCQNDEYIDLCGQTSLLDLMTFIGEASVVLTPDSAALHYALLTATNTVVISNGTNWQRFTNYQPYVKHQVKVVYPKWLQLDSNHLKLQYSHTEIQSITVQQIVDAIYAVKP